MFAGAPRTYAGDPGTNVYIDPETGMWRASRDVERESPQGIIYGYTADGDTYPVYEEKVEPMDSTNKKPAKPKKKNDVDINKAINDIVRKYVVVRNSALGVECYIPSGKVPDLIKDIAELVKDYVANEVKKKRASNKKAAKESDIAAEKAAEMWEKFNKQIGQIKIDERWGYPVAPKYQPKVDPQTRWGNRFYVSDNTSHEKYKTES